MNAHVGFVTQIGLEVEEQLQFADEQGFDYVELLLDGPTAHHRIVDRTTEITNAVDDAGLDMAVHLPFPTDIGSPYPNIRQGAIETQKAAIDIATTLGAKKGVIHPESSAWSISWQKEERQTAVIESIRELSDYAQRYDFELCAENLFDNVYTIKNMDELLTETDVSMTLDTGHARVEGFDSGETAAFVTKHSDRISHVHLNDTRRPADEHLPFGSGTIDFEQIFAAFPDEWSGTLSLEVGTNSFRYLKQSKEVLETLI